MNPLDALVTGGTKAVGALQDALSAPQMTRYSNLLWSKPPPSTGYQTALSPADEAKFQNWVTTNKVPFDPSPTADYDMRGFWRGLTTGDPKAQSAINPNDNQLHYPDYWKTPYHESFSAESQWATGNAPTWNEKNQLVTPGGNVVFDESRQPNALLQALGTGP